jgi:hypothetical protein
MPALLLSMFSCFCQDKYGQLINKADSFYMESNYQMATHSYEAAFKVRKPLLGDLYNCAACYISQGEKDKGFYYLQQLITRGFADTKKIGSDSSFEPVWKDARWIPMLDKVAVNKSKMMGKYGIDLIEELKKIYDADQLYRNQYLDLLKVEHKNYEDLSRIRDSIIHYDSINIERITALIDKYGWPGMDVVGGLGNMAAFFVIQHADLATRKKYLPLVKRSVKERQTPITHYAYLLDRTLTDEGKKQIYGTQLEMDTLINKNKLLPVKDPRSLNKRRKEIGLCTIEQYLKENN